MKRHFLDALLWLIRPLESWHQWSRLRRIRRDLRPQSHPTADQRAPVPDRFQIHPEEEKRFQSLEDHLDEGERYILRAAVLFEDAKTGIWQVASVFAPGHHAEVLHYFHTHYPHYKEADQGFLDNRGYYHDRRSALIVARGAGQVRHKHGSESTLFSEDMWNLVREDPGFQRLYTRDWRSKFTSRVRSWVWRQKVALDRQ